MDNKSRKRRSRSRTDVRDLRSKLTSRRRSSPSQFEELDFRKYSRRRSRSPARRSRSPSRQSSLPRSSTDSRKSYQKFLEERENFLREQQSLEKAKGRTRSRSRSPEDYKHKKKKKKHKHKKDKKRDRRLKEKSKSKEKERKPEESSNVTNSNEPEVVKEETCEERDKNLKENAPQSDESAIEAKRENLESDQTIESDQQQQPAGPNLADSDLDSNFDDFDENELSSLSDSSLSLSSIEDEDQPKVSVPIDGWELHPVVAFHRRPSNKISLSPTDRSIRRSRSNSRPYESRNSRSISPTPQRSRASWESRVAEFIQSVGGDLAHTPNIRFLESVATNSAPVYTPYPSLAQPMTSYPSTYGIAQPAASLDLNGTVSFASIHNSFAVPPPFNSSTWSASTVPNGSTSVSVQLPIEIEEEPPHEEVVTTPLIKFVGQKLTEKKVTNLRSLKEGFFRYNLLSVASRGEWIAFRVISTFDKSGLTESKLYDMAALKGKQGFREYLKDAVESKTVDFGSLVLSQQDLKLVHCVIAFIVKYFTFDGSADGGEDEDEDIDLEDEVNNDVSDKPATDESKPVQIRGLADLVKNLSAAEASKAQNEPELPPVNPWSNMWNWMQSENFKTFLDLKNNLAKGFMASGTSKFAKNPFDAAQELVSCWVIAGFNLNTLKQMLMSAEDGRILPPQNYSLEMGKYLFHELLDKLKFHRSTFPAHLVDEDLEFLVRKTLIYVARGCDRMSALSSNPLLAKFSNHHAKNRGNLPSSINYVYNYLPPGLRESENSLKSTSTELAKKDEADDEDTTDYLSSDPLNRIIDPVAGSHRPGELPYRKYLIGAVHVDWVIINGKPEIFELSIYVTDMTSLDMYIVTEALQKHQDTLEHLNFVANPDRHEFYFVQVGIGCVRAEWKEKAMDKLSKFLEEKRHSSSENQNNGLVLLFRGEEELSVLLSAWQATGHNDLLLDTVKGFGCLDNYMDKHKSANLELVSPKLNVGGNEAFFSADVKRGLKVSKLISKSKGQALYQACEIFLDQPPNYQNFIQPYCFPSFSSQVTNLKQRLKQIEEMYPVEVFIAASLKRDLNVTQSLFLEGVFAPSRHRDLRDKCSIVASRFIVAIITAGLDRSTLKKRFKRDPSFCINSSVILDRMSVAQRMSVTDQTMRCIHLLKEYFKENLVSN